jgi:beta-galactosidase GanA
LHVSRRASLMTATLLLILPVTCAVAQEVPHIENHDGRFAMVVDGKPFFMLGAQINNSSSWASTLPDVWPALRDLHVNTVEAPVYWEQMEPQQGKFDFSNVDLLITGAREQHMHLTLLWFGTWKNGQNHYVPEWVKTDPTQYRREVNAYGKLLDVMSPNSDANMEADKRAFAALMRHVREIDSEQHTVILVQVENESGSVGAVRDFSSAAQKEFAAPVPGILTEALHTEPGTWSQVFRADADEVFAAYSTAHYINEVAKAGKAEYPLPMYCNVWITYPVHALENRKHPSAGQEYPSGGAQQQNIAIWKAIAPSIDVLAPDFYSEDATLFHQIVATYHRSDNPLFIPETGLSKKFGDYFFYALGNGAIGFSPFGVDYTGWTLENHKIPGWLSEDYALFEPMQQEIAQLNLKGKLQTNVEEPGMQRQTIHFEDVEAVVSYGFPQHDGEVPPGTADGHGRVMVAEIAALEFLVTGVDASVTFQLNSDYGKTHNEQLEIVRAEQGHYESGVWKVERIWNGDQTDRGLNFKGGQGAVVRIRLHRLPLMIQ